MKFKKIISVMVLITSMASFSFDVSAQDFIKLSNDELLDIASGYTSYRIDGEYMDFESFTDEHKGIYSGYHLEHAEKEQVVLSFITDSTEFSFEYAVEVDNSGYIEVFVDGAYENSFNLSDMGKDGVFSYSLQGKECCVDVYLPRNGIKIKNFFVTSDSMIKPVNERTKAVFYGDSITFGTGLEKVSETYVSVLSRMLNYEFLNYGIGGYYFNPEQFVAQDIFEPEVVFVAYGANDAGLADITGFNNTVESFMKNLRKLYPEQKVYVITPLWTNDKGKTENIQKVRDIISEVCSKCDNVQVIEGPSLIPADTAYFSDGLHPNKIGDLVMAKNIAMNIDDTIYTDVTEMGEYDTFFENFNFNDYPANIVNGNTFAYCKDTMVNMKGRQAVYENGRFFVPTKLIDILSEREQPEIYNGNIPEMKVNVELIADSNSSTGMKCKLDFINLLHEKEISGTFRFTYPESFAILEPIRIEKVPGNGKYSCEFECPKIDVNKTGYFFKNEIKTDDGKTYKNSTLFRGFVQNNYAEKSITIDGVIDEEWEEAVKISCNSEASVRAIFDWGGTKDLSFEFSSMWDEKFLYFYADVKDNVFSQNNPPSRVWRGDCIQLGLYDNKDGKLLSGNAGTRFEEIALAIAEDKPIAYRFGTQTANTIAGLIEKDENFEIECVKTPDGVIYEMKISWDKLFGSNYTLDKNNGIGFSVLVNDDDGKGRRGWMEYGSGIGDTKNVDQFVKMQLNSGDEIRLIYNGEKIECDIKPIILNDKVLVPVRAIFEKIGAKVDWEEETRTVISTYKDKSVHIKIGSNIIQVNGDDVEIDVPAQIINNRTFVPVRAVYECYGCHVEWNEGTKTVIINGDAK